MAGLNLIPNLGVTAVVTAIFLLNISIIKNLFLMPYLRLKKLKENETTDSQKEAEELISQANSFATQIEKAYAEANSEAKAQSAEIIGHAKAQSEKIVKDTQNKTKTEVESLKAKIKEKLNSEKTKIDSTVSSISKQVIEKALN